MAAAQTQFDNDRGGNNVQMTVLTHGTAAASVSPFTQFASLTMLAEVGVAGTGARSGSNRKATKAAPSASVKNDRQSASGGSNVSLETIRNAVQQRDAETLKSLLRSLDWPATHSSRRALWAELITLVAPDETAAYREAVGKLSSSIPSLPSFANAAHTHSYCLRPTGVHAVHRILAVLQLHYPHVTACPMLFPLAAVFLHYASEELCYSALCALLSNRPRQLDKRAAKSDTKQRLDWIIQTQQAFDVSILTVRTLVKKYAPVAFAYLKSVLGEKDVFVFYDDWLWWLVEFLPLDHLIRVLDCYLLEGIKIFYRITIILIKSFHLHSKEHQPFASSAELIGAMKQHCRAGAAMSPDELLGLAFKLRGFSKAQLLRYYSRFESSIGDYRALRLARSDLQRPAAAASGSTADRDGNVDHVAAPLAAEHIEALNSSIVNADQLRAIWSWLPERIQLHRPTVVFCTNEHGYSLNTLYTRSDQYEPTLLLVRSAKSAVFGAYCSAAWCEREAARTAGGAQRGGAPAFFGTGESFVFTLAPAIRVFKWAGADAARHGSRDKEKEPSHAFQIGVRDSLAVGGYGRDAAISVDEGLTKGTSRRCSTFNNECLAGEEDFDIVSVEVIALERT